MTSAGPRAPKPDAQRHPLPLWLGGLLLLLGCGEAPSPQPHIGTTKRVLVVTFDTTRADALGIYGDTEVKTPTVDRLGEEGLVFENAFTVTPVTLPSHTSLLTGVYPPEHGVRDNGLYKLSQRATLLSEVLQEEGYKTGAFVGAVVLDAQYGLDQGFDVYKGPDGPAMVFAPHILERRAEEVVDDAIAWIDTLTDDDPYFMWVHFYDPHVTYDPPEPYASEYDDPYRGEIAYCDAQLARLLDHLRQRGLDEDLLTVLTSDHGESLDEHGERGHGVFIYNATMNIPLILTPPKSANVTPARVASAVSITDIASTILEFTGVDRDRLPESRFPTLLEAAQVDEDERAVYLESLLPYNMCRWYPPKGVVWRDYKFIEGKGQELYSLATDRNELQDLIHEQSDRATAMRARLRQLVEDHQSLGWEDDVLLDDVERKRLEALGYTSVGRAQGGESFDASLPDPRDRIDDLAKRERARELVEKGKRAIERPGTQDPMQRAQKRRQGEGMLSEAVVLLREILDSNPNDPATNASLGSLQTYRGRYDEARLLLENAAVILPSIPNVHFNLAICYNQQGKVDWMIAELEKTIACEPSLAASYSLLAQVHEEKGEIGRALFWVQEMEKNAILGDAERKALPARLKALEDLAKEKGQTVNGPEIYPVEELLPEGVLDQERREKEGSD